MKVARCVGLLFVIPVLRAFAVGQPADAQPVPVDTVLALGVLEGDPHQSFSPIREVEFGPDGSVLLLTGFGAGSGSVAWFSGDGAFLDRPGRYGEGPGELKGPDAISIDSAGRLHVLDQGNGRISMYAMEDRTFRYLDAIRLNWIPTDLCHMDSLTYLLALDGSEIIRVMDGDGRIVSAFGSPIRMDSELRQALGTTNMPQLNDGLLLCDGRHDRVYYASAALGELRSYTPDGVEQWRITLMDFHRTAYSREGGGVMHRPNPATGTQMSVWGLAVTETGDLAVGLAELEGSTLFYQERSLSAVDGTEIDRRTTPTVLKARSGSLRAGAVRHPYPRVIVTRERGGR